MRAQLSASRVHPSTATDVRPHGPWWVALPAIAAAAAALALPGPTGSAAAIASVLSLGALALLAGHTWGMLVVAMADVLLLGHVWPVLAFSDGPLATHWAAAATLACTLPGLTLLGVAIPALVDVVLGDPGHRMHRVGVTVGSLALAAAVVLPAL